MSDGNQDPDSAVDALVRSYLERRAEKIDPASVYARLCAGLVAAQRSAATARPQQRRQRTWRRLISAGALAAVALLAFWSGLELASGRPASAKMLVQQAQVAHKLPLDRAYLVEVRRDAGAEENASPVGPPRVIRLWTRDDRFWIESVQPQRTWAWGRDEQGNVWMAFGQRRGIRFSRDEVPQWLALGCDVFAMQLETLLNEVLLDFDLARSTNGASMPATVVVSATLKPGCQHPSLRHARIEIDAETKVIRQLVLTRTRQGQPFATITYTLVDSRPQDNRRYELAGHLAEPSELFTPKTHPEECQKLLDSWFDPRHGEPFHLPNPGP